MSKHDGSDGEPSPVQFAPPPDDDNSDSSSAISMESIPKVKSLLSSRDSSPLPQVKRRPPALQRRSSSNDTYKRSNAVELSSHGGIDSAGLGISVSSTIYPISATGRHSFIDLDDTTPTLDTHLGRSNRPREDAQGSHLSPANVMYPTPTRATFRPHSRTGTVRSDTSQLPMFSQPDTGNASYQPVAPKERRRPRPQSMLISPTSSANNLFDGAEALEPSGSKPPLPKGPKPPQFLRKAAVASSNPSSPKEYSSAQQHLLPPTTNTRDPGERQELVRKHRKLAQMFGEGVTGMLRPSDSNAARARVRGPLPPSSHRKGSHSADTNEEGRGQLLIIGPVRRHSTPTSGEFGEYAKMVRSDDDTSMKPGSRSPASFMELSDEESEARRGDDLSSVLTQEPEATAERDRKKMRDKLAKLHRFLGSRVPVELALGVEYALTDQDLPKPAPAAVSPVSDKEGDVVKDGGKKWKRRRRSSSSAALPGYVGVPPPNEHPPEDNPDERIKDELGDKERALNLKRANKMEQMFGARPPPTLYQTRPASSSASKPLRLNAPTSEPFLLPVVDITANASSHKGKGHYGKRPGTSESSQGLLAEDRDRLSQSISPVYMHYRHSLNSLTDIIDKDDKASLAELHQYINGPSSSDDEAASIYPASPSASIAIGHSLERRRSLPARTSLISIASSISIPPPAPDPGGFQQRRRRAAKLTNFFGVNYRDLFGDVLDSIEMGMREDVYAGSLREEELEELMRKLRKLKTRRDEIVS